MDSHEEKVYQAVRQSQEREAKQKMREKAKEFQRQRMEQAKRGGSMGSFGSKQGYGASDGFGSSGGISNTSAITTPSIDTSNSDIKPMAKPASKPISKNALKLGGKSKDVDTFVDQLKSEGEKITNLTPANTTASTVSKPKIASDVHLEGIHLKMEDKIVVRLGRDGGLQTFELSGLLTLRISDDKFGRIKVVLENNDTRGIQLQTHPNVDKELFKTKCCIGLKNPAKPFPLNTDVGVLKWRYQTQDESAIPLTINCWPSENGDGGCDVNIEYELECQRLELQDVCINIPLPMSIHPNVGECDGSYNFDARKHQLQWNLPIIDANNKAGSLEFSCASSIPSDFFPLQVSFVSKTPYADLKAKEVLAIDDEAPVKFSKESFLYVDKYEIV